MRLSEAIRLGAMLRPQGFETMLHNGRSCALGAAFEAANVPAMEADTNLTAYFSGVSCRVRIRCPRCHAIFMYGDSATGAALAVTIAHLNDVHRWTRERIADWVEMLEARAESAALPALDPHAADPGTLTTRV